MAEKYENGQDFLNVRHYPYIEYKCFKLFSDTIENILGKNFAIACRSEFTGLALVWVALLFHVNIRETNRLSLGDQRNIEKIHIF